MKPIPAGMEKRWPCPECARRYAREADLTRHIRNVHYIVRPARIDGEERP